MYVSDFVHLSLFLDTVIPENTAIPLLKIGMVYAYMKGDGV